MEDAIFLSLCHSQYNAAIKMMQKLIEACPEDLWKKHTKFPPFWQQIYHILYYLDFYSENSPKNFKPQFSIKEDLNEKLDDFLTKEELMKYASKLKQKINTKLDFLSTKKLESKTEFHWTGTTEAEKIVYNLRHAQHHIGQLNFLLKNEGYEPVKWILAG